MGCADVPFASLSIPYTRLTTKVRKPKAYSFYEARVEASGEDNVDTASHRKIEQGLHARRLVKTAQRTSKWPHGSNTMNALSKIEEEAGLCPVILHFCTLCPPVRTILQRCPQPAVLPLQDIQNTCAPSTFIGGRRLLVCTRISPLLQIV